jgi:hypothetical protein
MKENSTKMTNYKAVRYDGGAQVTVENLKKLQTRFEAGYL